MKIEAIMTLTTFIAGVTTVTVPVQGSLSHVVRQACGYIAWKTSCAEGWGAFDTDGGNPDLNNVLCSCSLRGDDYIEIVVSEVAVSDSSEAQVAWSVMEV